MSKYFSLVTGIKRECINEETGLGLLWMYWNMNE
jgi:hypothetical protein